MRIICREAHVPSHSLPLGSFALQNLTAVHLSNEHIVIAWVTIKTTWLPSFLQCLFIANMLGNEMY